MTSPATRVSPKFGPWQFVVLGLSCFVLAALIAETFFPLSDDVRQILRDSDTLVCVVFLADFLVRWVRAENKAAFMKWGWIDLISSIPMLDALRWGGVVRVIRILRILRGIRSIKIILEFLFANRAHGTAASATVFSLLLVVSCSIAILQFEVDAEHANIKSGADAIWWCMATITTVGYGDRFPVTVEGRIIGAMLMTAGVGLFGVLSGVIASWFLGGQRQPEQVSLSELKADIEEIKRLLAARIDSPSHIADLSLRVSQLDEVVQSPAAQDTPDHRHY